MTCGDVAERLIAPSLPLGGPGTPGFASSNLAISSFFGPFHKGHRTVAVAFQKWRRPFAPYSVGPTLRQQRQPRITTLGLAPEL